MPARSVQALNAAAATNPSSERAATLRIVRFPRRLVQKVARPVGRRDTLEFTGRRREVEAIEKIVRANVGGVKRRQTEDLFREL